MHGSGLPACRREAMHSRRHQPATTACTAVLERGRRLLRRRRARHNTTTGRSAEPRPTVTAQRSQRVGGGGCLGPTPTPGTHTKHCTTTLLQLAGPTWHMLSAPDQLNTQPHPTVSINPCQAVCMQGVAQVLPGPAGRHRLCALLVSYSSVKGGPGRACRLCR
jgi:hypothetical protein